MSSRQWQWPEPMPEPPDFASLQDYVESVEPVELPTGDSKDLPAPATSDWSPIDLTTALAGGLLEEPSVMRRDDGLAMFYPGKHHLVYGESESGKSWLAQAAVAEQIRRAKRVLYVDFESDERSVVERLLALGVRKDYLAECLDYVSPSSAPTTEAAKNALDHLRRLRYALVVVDGVTEGMGVFGLSPRDEAGVADFYGRLPEALARATGAAVVSIDHVALNKETRGRFALGSQHKISGLTGAAYLLDEVRQPFGRGQHGVVRVCVAKDRPGAIRGRSGPMQPNRTQIFAEFHLISPDAALGGFARVIAELRSLEPSAQQAASPGDVRPTWYMEQISQLLERADAGDEWSATKIEMAIKDDRDAEGKHFNRAAFRRALGLLVAEGYVTADTTRQKHRHTSNRPYRQADDA